MVKVVFIKYHSNQKSFELIKPKNLHRPGIEPGPPAWQASILPLNHRCLLYRVVNVVIVAKNDLLMA